MTRPSVNELLKLVNLYKDIIELVTKENIRLYEEIKAIKFDKNAVSSKKYDDLLANAEILKLQLVEYRKLYFFEKKKAKEQPAQKLRGADETTQSDELIYKILNLKEQGLSVRTIARELNTPLGIVYKIFYEEKNILKS
ncbi:resolvase (plasmid) [Clostridium beijerinckii]|uniref:resolvase n=1 Tax=Clostridium beijerinckii TaxID=1520 RepID=UPI002227C053|nr:resolvase [Clostridium beijerinckii]UYZ39036.1 resolvase [Clostridium beijerinckii]